MEVQPAEFASTFSFTDEPLVAGMMAKAVHVAQIQTAIDQLRQAAGLDLATFTPGVAPGGMIRAVHVTELQSALDAGRLASGVESATYSESVSPGALLRATHL